jgi:hypothetical protein
VSTTTWVQLPSATSTLPCAVTTRLRPHALYVNLAVRRDYLSPAARDLPQPCRALRLLVTRPHVLYVNLNVHRENSSPLSRLQRSTSTTSRVRMPRHVTRLITRLVAPLVVDYFAYAARPGASARRVARRRLLRLHRASGCLGTSRGSSRRSSSTTSTTSRVRVPQHIARLVTRLVVPLVVDYFASRRLVVDYSAYAARPGASACRVARHAAPRRLLRLRRASGCLGTSRGSSRGSSSTTSPTPRVRVPRHVAWLISPLVVDYFAYATRPGASALRVAHLTARRRLLHLRRASGCLGTSRGSSRGSSSTTSCAVTSSCGHTGSTSATSCVATTCLAATVALLRVRRVLPRCRLPVASRRPLISTSFPN